VPHRAAMTKLSCIGHTQAYFIVLCIGFATLLPWNAAINASVVPAAQLRFQPWLGCGNSLISDHCFLERRFDFFDETLGSDFNFWFSGAYVWPQVIVLGIVVKVRSYSSM